MKSSNKDLLFIDYLYTLTDDTGILQHSVYGIPDPHKGYTTDDNARALVLTVALYDFFGDREYLYPLYRYLAFLLYAQKEDGLFLNFMNYNREFIKEKASEDCFGRCLWALGRTAASPSIPENIKRTCTQIFKNALPHCEKLNSPRAKALAIAGLCYLEETKETLRLIDSLSGSLVGQYKNNKTADWHWFEDSIAYGNALLPWALVKAYSVLKKDSLLETAKESAGFLSGIMLVGDFFKPVGCNGWYSKGGEKAEFDEQPLEAGEMTLLFTELYTITKNKKYLEQAGKCFSWYSGCNSQGLSLIDNETGACYDGLVNKGVNYNQGAESIITYGIAFIEIAGKNKISGHKMKKITSL